VPAEKFDGMLRRYRVKKNVPPSVPAAVLAASCRQFRRAGRTPDSQRDAGVTFVGSNMIIARKCFIRGLVQGVGFRFFTQRVAARHQVLGYVKNLEDGRVEVHIEGDEKAVQEFINDLSTGPTFSRVEEIEEIVLDPIGSFTAFRIER
jgi:acylphosphatase